MNKKIFKSVLLASVLLSVISTPVKSADFTPSNQTYDIYGYQNANSLTVSGTVENNTTTNTSNPQAYSFGGAIYNTGTLNVSENTIFQKNYLNGSTTDNEYYQGSAGGAIANYGNLTIGNNVQFIQNGFKNSGAISEAINDAAGLSAAAGAIDGGAIFSNSLGAVITIGNGVKFQNNIAAGYGGAIYSIDGKVTIGENATFENNISHYGGAITNDQTNGTASLTIGNGASFTGNKAINDNGGAIANWYGTTTIGENAKFTDNSSGYAGGALFNSDSATMSVAKNAAFSGNSSKADADGGGAISNRGNLTVNGGTTFSKNSAAVSGGAVYNKGKIIFDTTDGNITFSENTAKRGSDLFLNDNSTVEITGTSADNKISFGSQKSIAGSGNIVNKSNGIVEIINNKDLSDFTGIYTQENGTLSLDNSTIFNSYDIKSGELQILNGSVAEINGTTKKLADGTVLKVAGADSLLTLKGATIGENTQVNLQGGGKIDITGGSSLSLYQSPVSFFSVKDDGDTWEGDIHVSNDGDNSLTLNNFTHDTSNGGGNLTVDGGSVNLEGSSNLTLGNTESSI